MTALTCFAEEPANMVPALRHFGSTPAPGHHLALDGGRATLR